MKVRYLYSACVSIETDDCTILCDPWWSPAYEGSWCQYPIWAYSLDEAIAVLGEAQYIFCSHIHPDHFDIQLLKAYLAKYPLARVLIAEQKPDLLGRKLRSRGIHPIVGLHHHGETWLTPIPNRANPDGINIDSALVVKHGEHTVANLNDNPYDQAQIDSIKFYTADHPTVALLPFVGAGPWPQCYAFETPDEQQKAAAAKKQKYLDLFSRYCQALQPTLAVPFAGQYWLHGPQLDLNPLRGMADATECVPLYRKKVWVPNDGGQSTLSLHKNGAWQHNGTRVKPYDWPTVEHVLMCEDRAVNEYFYRYEREIQIPVERLPLQKLLISAWRNAHARFHARTTNLYLCIKTQLPQWFVCDTTNIGVLERDEAYIAQLMPRIEVYIDARYLFSMLTRLSNANSVRIGSLCRFKCVPNIYDKELDDLFGEFWDSLRV